MIMNHLLHSQSAGDKFSKCNSLHIISKPDWARKAAKCAADRRIELCEGHENHGASQPVKAATFHRYWDSREDFRLR